MPKYYQYTYGGSEAPHIVSNPSELAKINNYIEPSTALSGSLFRPNINYQKALKDGINPQALADYQQLQHLNPTGMEKFGQIVDTGSQLAGLAMAFGNYLDQSKLMNQQMKIEQEKWNETKADIARVKQVRSRLAKLY